MCKNTDLQPAFTAYSRQRFRCVKGYTLFDSTQLLSWWKFVTVSFVWRDFSASYGGLSAELPRGVVKIASSYPTAAEQKFFT